ncbi:MAG: hypothetical protein WA584_23165 [Pyrinomonadaceae bacterium]
MNNEKNISSPFLYPSEKILSNSAINKSEAVAKNWTIWHVGAGIGLLGGLLVLFGTAFLIIFEYLTGEKSPGIWLFTAVLPLWIFGAYCFDKLEELEKERMRRYYETANE